MPDFFGHLDPGVTSIKRFLTTNRFFPLILFFIVLFPVIDLAFFNYTQTKQDLTTAMLSRRGVIASLVSDLVEEKLSQVISLGDSLAGDEQVQSLIAKGKWEEAAVLVKDVPQKFPYIDRITLYDTKGILRADTPHISGFTGQDFSYRDWYQGVTRTKKPYVSTVYRRVEEPQVNVVAVAIPLVAQSPDNAVLGTLVFQLKLDTLLNWTQEIQIGEEGFIYVVDQSGHIVAHPKYPPQGQIVDFSPVSVVQKALRGQDGVEEFYNVVDKEQRLTAYEALPRFGWGVFVAQPAVLAFAQRESSLRTILFVYGFAGVLMVVLFYVLLRAYSLARSQAVFIATEMTASLRDSEERYRKLVETSPDAIVVMDLQTKIMMANQQAIRLVRVDSSAEILGKNAFAFIAPEDHERTRANLLKLASVYRLTGIEYTLIRKDGTRFIGSTSASLMTDRHGKPQWIIVVIRDITREKQLDHLKDEFISMSSHELRTPMTAIKGYISMILNGKYGVVAAEMQKPLLTIASSTDRLINLVNDLLSVSRIETKRLKLNLTSFSASDLLRDVAASLESMAKEKNLTVAVTVSEIPIQADAEKLKQIFINLLGNAIKFTDSGGVSISSAEAGEYMIFSVTDTGIGIAKESRDNLFGKFQQISSQQIGRPGGTGLGLYISREYARAMGGDVSLVASEPGKGSTFTLSLPKANSSVARDRAAKFQTANTPLVRKEGSDISG